MCQRCDLQTVECPIDHSTWDMNKEESWVVEFTEIDGNGDSVNLVYRCSNCLKRLMWTK